MRHHVLPGMISSMPRRSSLVLGALLLASACGSEPEQVAVRTDPPAQPQPPPAEVPPAKPQAADEAEVPPSNYKIVVAGGPDIQQAVINTPSTLVDAKVDHGREITFSYPPEEHGRVADVIAERSPDDVVHWPKVDLGEAKDGQVRLEAANALPNLPEMTPERRAQLRAKLPDLTLWSEDDTPDKPPAATQTVKVTFTANELYTVVLKIQPDHGRTVQKKLDPKITLSLAPGRHRLSYKEDGGDWQDAGTILIAAGKSYLVQLLDEPPWHKLSTN